MIAVKLDLPETAIPIYKHALNLVGQLANTQIDFSQEAQITIGVEGQGRSIEISSAWLEQLTQKDFNHEKVLRDSPVIALQTGEPDYLSSAVYLMNYLQEYAAEEDDLGRFPFGASLQKRFGVADSNLVHDYFQQVTRQLGISEILSKPSRLFVSHDNDSLYGSFTKDGFYALKNGRLDWLFRIVWSEIMQNPRWMNMGQMMDINDEYDLKSTFFWIANNRPTKVGNRMLNNGDYQISNSKTQAIIDKISERGFHQGLHKSVNDQSFSEELEMLPYSAKSNRNHYLKLNIPHHFSQLDKSDVEIDFSLGFAEEFGLRNNYALPVRPFDVSRDKQCKALYVPLMVMDTTNWSYRKQDLKGLKSNLLDLMEKHKEDAIISVLWHNKYFTDMKFSGYLEVYRAMLDFCRNSGIRPITQEEILREYSAS